VRYDRPEGGDHQREEVGPSVQSALQRDGRPVRQLVDLALRERRPVLRSSWFSPVAEPERWLVPHFEKMLYDNALLARTYCEAYQATRKERYRQVAEEILHYVLREMRSPEGGFYSAQDADSEGEEGKHFVWTRDQIKEI
jgi:hypothetical protein